VSLVAVVMLFGALYAVAELVMDYVFGPKKQTTAEFAVEMQEIYRRALKQFLDDRPSC
jgi:hypothetical protein